MRVLVVIMTIATVIAFACDSSCHHDWAKWPGHPNNGGMYTCQKCGATERITW